MAPPAPSPRTKKSFQAGGRREVSGPEEGECGIHAGGPGARRTQPSTQPRDAWQMKCGPRKLEMVFSPRKCVRACAHTQHTRAHAHSSLGHKDINIHEVIGDLCLFICTSRLSKINACYLYQPKEKPYFFPLKDFHHLRYRDSTTEEQLKAIHLKQENTIRHDDTVQNCLY